MIALISLNRLMFNTLEGLYLYKDDKVASTPWYAVPETMRMKIEDSLCHGLKDEMDMKVRKSIALCAARWTEESHARNSRKSPTSLAREADRQVHSENSQPSLYPSQPPFKHGIAIPHSKSSPIVHYCSTCATRTIQ